MSANSKMKEYCDHEMFTFMTSGGSGSAPSEPFPEVICPMCKESLLGMYWFCPHCGWKRNKDPWQVDVEIFH